MNCVSFYNSVYFNSFLVYSTLGLLFCCWMTYSPFMECAIKLRYSSSSSSSSSSSTATTTIPSTFDYYRCQVMGDKSLLFLPCLVICWCTFLLSAWQMMLFLTDISNYEFIKKQRSESWRWVFYKFVPAVGKSLKYHLLLIGFIPRYFISYSYVSRCGLEAGKAIKDLGIVHSAASSSSLTSAFTSSTTSSTSSSSSMIMTTRFTALIKNRKPKWYYYLVPLTVPVKKGAISELQSSKLTAQWV